MVPPPRIERWDALGCELGVDLYVARDDLLPFPLAGNKVRKLVSELAPISAGTTIITNGAVDSNHCRTAAWLAAERGLQAHLILHDEKSQGPNAPGLMILDALGASYDVVSPNAISATIQRTKADLSDEKKSVHIVPGGCHSKRGAVAYRVAAEQVFDEISFDAVYLASGTGATHGGIAAAAAQRDDAIEVVGVSVARTAERGARSVTEAASWAGSPDAKITFLDGFTAGGYGKTSPELHEIVALGWRFGLPLDTTYTGKTMWALRQHAKAGKLSGKRVLFWHTGGLWNHLSSSVFRHANGIPTWGK